MEYSFSTFSFTLGWLFFKIVVQLFIACYIISITKKLLAWHLTRQFISFLRCSLLVVWQDTCGVLWCTKLTYEHEISDVMPNMPTTRRSCDSASFRAHAKALCKMAHATENACKWFSEERTYGQIRWQWLKKIACASAGDFFIKSLSTVSIF